VDRDRERPFRLAVTLLGLAVLAFGVGAGLEVAGRGRGLVIAAAAVLVLVFVLVLRRGRAQRDGHAAAARAAVARYEPGRLEAACRFEGARFEGARFGGGRFEGFQQYPDLLEGQAVLEDPALRTERARLGDSPLPDRPAYALGVAGGAALALTLGGVLFLALPSDYTALTVLLVGVLAWTAVVLFAFRRQSRGG
jgi:hypothetical protein